MYDIARDPSPQYRVELTLDEGSVGSYQRYVLAGHATLAGAGRETAPHRVPDGREVRGSLRVLSCTLLQLSCSARHLPLLAFHPVGQLIVCLF
jgi:hypothetical protein